MQNKAPSDSDLKRNFLWNAIGAAFNALNSLMFTIIVTRFLGMREAGYFTLAFTTSVVLSNIGLFNMRSFQITDTHSEYTDRQYLGSRTMTTLAMMAAFFLYALTKRFDARQMAVIMALGLWRVPEVLADVMHGTLQMNNRLDLAGKSVLAKAVAGLVLFAAALAVSQSVVIASLAILLASSAVFVLYDIPNYRKVHLSGRQLIDRAVLLLLAKCTPLFMIAILYSYILNAPKYFIDQFSTPENQTVFAVIVMPASMIWLLFSLILNPLLPALSSRYHEPRRKAFDLMVGRILLAIAVFTAAYELVIASFGITVLERIYQIPLTAYRGPFMIAGIGAGMLCVASVFSYLIIIQRKNMHLLLAYTMTTIISFLFSRHLVERYDLPGAAVSYLLIMVMLAATLSATFLFLDRKQVRKEIS